jgi:hypothetical protein
MPRTALSLSSELNLILDALEGIQLLAQLQAEDHLVGKQRHRATLATVAGLVVIRERLRQVDRIVRGVADPREILIAANRATPEDDDHEVRLPTWGSERTVAHHRRELERAESKGKAQLNRRKLKNAG